MRNNTWFLLVTELQLQVLRLMMSSWQLAQKIPLMGVLVTINSSPVKRELTIILVVRAQIPFLMPQEPKIYR